MSAKRVSRREFLSLAGAMGGAALLSACAPQATEPTTAPPPEEKEYHILQWAQAATPTPEDAQLAEGEARQVAYQNIADEYMALHPNVTIEFYTFPGGSSSEDLVPWLEARMAAQDAPDIWWANTDILMPHFSKGWMLDLTEYMDMANPYVDGNKSWKDQFIEVALISQLSPEGKVFGVDLDGVGIMIAYNKEAFDKAGVTTKPRTWGEFQEAWQKLKDAGYIAYGASILGGGIGGYNIPHWFSGHAYNQLVWDKVGGWDDDGNQKITSLEIASHAQKGDFPDWDAYLKFAHLLKELEPFLPPGYAGNLDIEQLFRQGKVAMFMNGNWATGAYAADPLPFEYDWLAFPVITKDIWPDAPEKVVRIQGAWGVLQYHVSGFLAEKEPDKVPVCMDWLMFSSAPENVSALCSETGTLPLVHDATTTPEMEPFLQPYDRAAPYESWWTLSEGGSQAEAKLFQTYLPGTMSDGEFLDLAKKLFDEELDKVLEQNPDWKIS